MSVHEFDRFPRTMCFSADFRDRVVAALRLAGLREEADQNHEPQADAGGTGTGEH